MNSCYSTFVPGLSEPVQKALIQTLPHCTARLVLDGLIAFESSTPIKEMKVIPFVTNTFYILKTFPRNSNRTVKEMALQILSDRRLVIKNLPRTKQSRTFRVIISLANQLVPLESNIIQALENRIAAQTKLQPDRSKPDYEFWILQRTEGYGFFSVRLSQRKAYDKTLQKGELRPEIANVLCRLSEPSAGELFLDPFCGSGAIPIQRAQFPAGLITASDNRQDKVDSLKQRLKQLGLQQRIVARCDNALQLSRFRDGSIHKIVTDPPWGHFEELQLPLAEFYDKMIVEFCRILAPHGLLVVLTAQTGQFEASVQKTGCKLTISNKFNTLVSGKKACVYVIQRTEST